MFAANSLLADYFYIGIILLCLASFVAGYIDSIAGGGGLITVPAFLMLGFLPQNALAQSKLVNSIGTMVAIRNFAKNKSIIWKIVPFGIIFALLGAFIGSKIILLLKPEVIYYVILGMVPFGLAITLYKSRMKNHHMIEDLQYSPISISTTCLLVGFYDGFFGPGAGSIFIIALYLINKIPLLNASGTSKIFNLSSNIGAFVVFALAGKMAFLIGIPMVLPSVLGNQLGSSHAIKTNGSVIKKALIVTVGIMLITLVIKLFNL